MCTDIKSNYFLSLAMTLRCYLIACGVQVLCVQVWQPAAYTHTHIHCGKHMGRMRQGGSKLGLLISHFIVNQSNWKSPSSLHLTSAGPGDSLTLVKERGRGSDNWTPKCKGRNKMSVATPSLGGGGRQEQLSHLWCCKATDCQRGVFWDIPLNQSPRDAKR